ncbi:Oxidoreductase, N-terminal domain [Dillenia turbinata]|uniref:Oxidoreductase, N-terminal domain n=1 Tax=Dillenia turbinata TaxID=194707 RepID=A0AAN8W5F5_9MAGN
MEVANKYVIIKSKVDGAPKESDFEMQTEKLVLSVKAGSKNIIVKNLYVSIDPYQLNRMKSQSSSQKTSSFAVGIKPGEAIDTYGVGRVVASENAEFEKGDLVGGLLTWGEYSIIKPGEMILRKLDPMGFPLSYHVGILAFSGLTAYGGFFEICKPKKGEKVLVSAASGSVGNLVGQYAKLHGCYVVGCAGTKQKVELLKTTLSFDDAFNYKEETDLKSTLKRVAACGVISEYTGTGKRAAPDMPDVVYKRITIRGFLAEDFMNLFGEFISSTVNYLRSGKMKIIEDISKGVETVPSAFVGLFRGDNVGKKMVRIADE